MITDDTVSSDEIHIAAPVELVWQVLVDFENYEKWNEFCPQCEAELEIGSPIKMQVELGFGLQEQIEYISLIKPFEAIAWGMENKPDDPIKAVRTQYLNKIDELSCSYQSVDVFSGEAVAGMMDLMGKPVEDGFNLCGYGLKAYCEKLVAAQVQ
jgi:hypothetical protein